MFSSYLLPKMSFLYSVLACAFLPLIMANPLDDHIYNGQIDDSPQARLIFHLSDKNNDTELIYTEFQQVFADFDTDNNGQINSTEFIDLWIQKDIGQIQQGVMLFLNLDVNRDVVIDQIMDMPYIFKFFDRNANHLISEGEFVIQWVKISL